jgi:hypothetical protein
MLDKLKGMGDQIQSLATGAMDTVDQATASTVQQAQKLAGATGEATSLMTEHAMRKAVRGLHQLMRYAAEEFEKDPPLGRPATLVGSIAAGMMSLQVEVEIGGKGAGDQPSGPVEETGADPEAS